MSSRRIAIGLLVGACLLAGALLAVRQFNLEPRLVPIALFIIACVVLLVMDLTNPAKRLRPYWERGCMGLRWRRRFPHAPKPELREFLRGFVDAFGFNQKKRACFSPDDRVMDVYVALYPPDDGMADGLELETLAGELKERYGLDLATVWREDITLGDLYRFASANDARRPGS